MKVQLILLLTCIIYGCRNKENPQPVKPATPSSAEFKRGEELFYDNSKKDSAFYYFTNVTEISKDSLLVAMAYTYMAMIQENADDFVGTQESALEGLRHLNEKNVAHHYCLSSLYNELGVSSAGLKNYDAAIEYYDLAIQFQQDESYKTIFQNNKAVAYREKGEYGQAITILRSILAKQRHNKTEYARVLTNLSSLRWQSDSAYYPVPELVDALNVRISEKDDNGIAASYDHLSDYYLKNKPDSAFLYAQKMYAVAYQINSADKKLDALRKLVSLAPASMSKQYFRLYQSLNDSIQLARTRAKNQYALIRYRSEKNKNENLLLQQDNSLKALELFRQRVWMYSVGTVVLIGIVFFILWLRKKRQQMEWQSQATIRQNQLNTSQRVHDIVANGLYRIMNEVEHKDDIEKEVLLDRIERLYERSRDISYNPESHESGIAQRINELLISFATEKTKVSVVGNQQKIWDMIPSGKAEDLEHVLQELMVNMSKHSYAKHVVVRFDLTNTTLTISYRDDGVGFPPDFKKGNGLKSTENRILRTGGELILAEESGIGVSIKIVIPISTA